MSGAAASSSGPEVVIRSALWSLAGLAALLMALPFGPGSDAATSPSLPRWTVLAGSLPPALASEERLRPLSTEMPLTVGVTLRLRNQRALNRLLNELYDPASPSYERFLTPSEFAARFGPSDASIKSVIAWLKRQGMQIEGISANKLQITTRGTVGLIQCAFKTPMYAFHQASREFFANTTRVRLPAALGGYVLAVSGLASTGQQRAWDSQHSPSKAKGSGYTPATISRLYHLNPLRAKGIDGSGQTVGIISFADYSSDNVAVFDSRFGLSSDVTRIPVSDGKTSGAQLGAIYGQDEIEADIEAVQGTAPGAQILAYEAPNTSAGGVAVYNRVVSDDRAAIVTTSWGNVESSFSADDRSAIHQDLEEGAAQGQAFFAPSGDNGAFDGADSGHQNTKRLAVDYPASDPWVTGVGGTTLTSRKSKYLQEVVWSDESDPWQPSGSGGGLSAIYARPGYQRGPGVHNHYSTAMRQVPDVAANADPATGYAAYVAGPRNSAGWTVMGGTSEATPLWAGFAALVNQATNRRLGFLNPTLYRLGKMKIAAHSPFHDITKGHNLFYPATRGWDFSTGWGSMDGAALVKAIVVEGA